MNFSDKERLKRVEEVFLRNYRLTRLYALYLERMPELITEEMVEALTEDGTLTVKDALVAILTELFGLDYDTLEDRLLIRDYLTPSVRVMRNEKYTENPYYKNIKIPNVKDGDWELKTEFYPAFRGFIAADMELHPDLTEIPPLGFFPKDFYYPAVLEGGNEWMTLTPVDLDTSEEAIEKARGRVVTFGLGLGYYAYMVSEKEDVESITVVEKSEKVIELFKKYILPQFAHPEKVRIINADAFLYAEKMADEKYDVAFADTWRDSSDGLPMYEKMKELEHFSPGTEFLYWIEGHILSRRRALNFERVIALTEKGDESMPKSFAEAMEMINGRLLD